MAKAKLPADLNKRAKSIVDIATNEGGELEAKNTLRNAAAELGREGGLKGGLARAKKLSPEKRSEIAKKAADARWKKRDLK